MAHDHFLSKISRSHLPTFMLIIGYPVFWLELYAFDHPTGNTTWLASVLFMLLALGVLVAKSSTFRWERFFPQEDDRLTRVIMIIGVLLCVVIMGVTLYASLLPPHLVQEYDALNYHITLPRQHLIVGSFAPIPWSSADLFLIPLDYALAPYWLVTTLPNKFPQFLFLIGMLLVSVRLTRRLGGGRGVAFSVVAAFLGMHAFIIQAGTAMTEIVACYLFLAALDSLMRGRVVLAAVELAFFACSKSFMLPFLAVAVLLTGGASFGYWHSIKKAVCTWGFRPPEVKVKSVHRFLLVLLLVVALFLTPVVFKSLRAAGTPLYPFFCGAFSEQLEQAPICKAADGLLVAKDAYGKGRGLKAFLEHLWFVAVPEKGVNNRFDYPLGLPFLLFLPPFWFLFWRSLRKGDFPLLPAFAIVYWGLWWSLGSQQSRFLFVPLALMIILVLSKLSSTVVLKGALVIALALSTVSMVRAHGGDLGRVGSEVLRDKDRRILLKGREVVRPGSMVLEGPDAAFAEVKVDVVGPSSVFVIEH